MQVAPRSGPEVLDVAKALARRFREAGAPVVLVRVAFAADYGDAPQGPRRPAAETGRRAAFPPAWTTLAEGLEQPGDIVVTKRHWGRVPRHGARCAATAARRRHDRAGGDRPTNFGVESTARDAWELNYSVVIVEDGCASPSAELHDMAVRHIFPADRAGGHRR